jgi:hypothetical protein
MINNTSTDEAHYIAVEEINKVYRGKKKPTMGQSQDDDDHVAQYCMCGI